MADLCWSLAIAGRRLDYSHLKNYDVKERGREREFNINILYSRFKRQLEKLTFSLAKMNLKIRIIYRIKKLFHTIYLTHFTLSAQII